MGRPVRCRSRMASGQRDSNTSPDKDKAGGVREQQHTPADGSPHLLICLSLPVAHLALCGMKCVCTVLYGVCVRVHTCIRPYM